VVSDYLPRHRGRADCGLNLMAASLLCGLGFSRTGEVGRSAARQGRVLDKLRPQSSHP
jgi:hypothetical protein